MLEDVPAGSPDEEADLLLARLPEDASLEEEIEAATQALEISEGCVSAWLILGMNAESHEAALELFERGIAAGRKRFADLLASSADGGGVWGWIEARDFMRLLHEKARVLELVGNFDEAREVYREMLELNPGDNQGVRGDLLLLMAANQPVAACRELVDRYPDDVDCAMLWGRVFVSILEAIERSGFEFSEEGPPAGMSPQAFLKSLGPEFAKPLREAKRAAERQPFVPLLFSGEGLMEVEIEDTVAIGGPYEAVHYLQRWALLWSLSGLPMVFLHAVVPRNLKKAPKSPRFGDELSDVMFQLDAYDGPPWWEMLDEEGE